jgi:hypothetical protein
LDLRACCCALLGAVLAKNDSLDRAAHWLAAAVRIDPYAADAFDTLVRGEGGGHALAKIKRQPRKPKRERECV